MMVTVNVNGASGMTSSDVKKRIKITSRGILSTKSGAYGPILVPYLESLSNIKNLITRDHANVVEVLDNGSEVDLTLKNYYLDNSVVMSDTKTDVKSTKTTSTQKVADTVSPKVTSTTNGSNDTTKESAVSTASTPVVNTSTNKAKNTEKVDTTPSDTTATSK